MAPAFALIAAGADPVRLLVVSQVALSVGLPSVLIPLVLLTSRRAVMGALVNRLVTTVTATVVTAAVIGPNGVLLYPGRHCVTAAQAPPASRLKGRGNRPLWKRS